jgi:hypothetical protein
LNFDKLEKKMFRFYHLSLCVLLVFLAGCSLPSRGPAADSPSSDADAESEPIIIPVEGTAAPTIPPNAPRDSCLEGTWIMPASSLDLLVASIIPESTPFLSIPSGQLKLTFTDVAFTYSGDFIMRVNNPDGSWAEGHALFENSGGYTTDMHMLTFDTQVSQSQMFDCKAGSGGQVFSTTCTFPMVTILPASTGPYGCWENRLELEILTPNGPMTMYFQR